MPRVYVMTSGNLSEEPIVKDDDEALARLAPLADAFLQHDRAIHIHCDDSVVRTFRGDVMPIRRARGYAPAPIRLPAELPPILAVGGELKNTFCLTNGRYAFMSQHIGDMENLETLHAFEHTVDHYTKIFRVEPSASPATCTRATCPRAGPRTTPPALACRSFLCSTTTRTSPHSWPSMASAPAEPRHRRRPGRHRLRPRRDHLGRRDTRQRLCELHPRRPPAPGASPRRRRGHPPPLSHRPRLSVGRRRRLGRRRLPPVQAASAEELRILRRQLETGLNATPTSSMGRLFDAVASLAGVRQAITYEAQAAMEFEALAGGEHVAHSEAVTSYDLTGAFIEPVDAGIDPPRTPCPRRLAF